MEQYGVPYESGQKVTEDIVGIINHLNIRSSYSESKRLCECLCASYADEYSINVMIARLAQTFGAGCPLDDNRMPMQFARAAVEGHDIILHTDGKGIINFVYLTDAIIGILTLLKKVSAVMHIIYAMIKRHEPSEALPNLLQTMSWEEI